MLIQKVSNPLYANIKITKQRNQRLKYKKGLNNDDSNTSQSISHLKSLSLIHERNKKHPLISSALYAGLSGPYLQYEDIRRKEYMESKKKWMDKKGFISSVSNSNKYLNNKYIYYK